MRKSIILIFFALLLQAGKAQSLADSGFYQSAGEKAIEKFLEAKVQNLPVYNGIQHIGYPHYIQGSAYYKSAAWQEGPVLYDGILYKNAFLKYDMVEEVLIIRQPNNLLGIILFGPRVSHFSFGNSTFIYKQKMDGQSIAEGFYEQLAEGKIGLLAKRKAVIEEGIVATEMLRRFVRKDQYYAVKDGIYYAIKNLNDMLNLLGEKKKDIQKYLKKNKIRFKKDPEYALVKISELFNQAID